MTYVWRLLALLAFFAAMAFWDWRRLGSQATRWKEYLFILGTGFVGAGVGILVDQVSITISPDYFLLAKGFDKDRSLRFQALILGFKAGFFAGLFVGMSLLIARGKATSLGYGFLLRRVLWPLGGGIILAPIGAVLVPVIDPGRDILNLAWAGLSAEGSAALLTVWGLHLGLYLGAVIGLALGCLGIWRLRSSGSAERVSEEGETQQEADVVEDGQDREEDEISSPDAVPEK